MVTSMARGISSLSSGMPSARASSYVAFEVASYLKLMRGVPLPEKQP